MSSDPNNIHEDGVCRRALQATITITKNESPLYAYHDPRSLLELWNFRQLLFNIVVAQPHQKIKMLIFLMCSLPPIMSLPIHLLRQEISERIRTASGPLHVAHIPAACSSAPQSGTAPYRYHMPTASRRACLCAPAHAAPAPLTGVL